MARGSKEEKAKEKAFNIFASLVAIVIFAGLQSNAFIFVQQFKSESVLKCFLEFSPRSCLVAKAINNFFELKHAPWIFVSTFFVLLFSLQSLLIGSLDSGSEHRLVMAALMLIYTSRRGVLERELRILLCTYEKSQG